MNNEEEMKINNVINNKINRLLAEMVHCFITTQNSKSKTSEFKEIRAFMKGIKAGAKLYSSALDVFIVKHRDFCEEDVTRYCHRMRQQTDMSVFTLTDSLEPPPPETEK